LGTGKTTLVRGIAAGLGAPPRVVSSPTFVLVHEYEGRFRFAHADLYRIEQAAELTHLGLDDYLDDSTVLAVEWAERARGALPTDRLEIRLAHVDRHRRDIRLQATGPRARAALSAICTGWPAARTQRTSRRRSAAR
jgi:tRNA threonylcarbamoyladenosine biosynthesis protein TsaE